MAGVVLPVDASMTRTVTSAVSGEEQAQVQTSAAIARA